MADTINVQNSLALINQLNETAIRYNRDIKYLPVAFLMDSLNRAGILPVPGIQNKLISYAFLRKGGIMRPYVQGMEASLEELGKFVQNEFRVYRAAGIDKDNIQIFYAIAATWGEDLGDIVFHGVRNEAGKTKFDLLDGYEKIIQDKITSGEISVANRNFVNTDPITFPVDDSDTTAFDIVDDFLAQSDIKGRAILNVTRDTFRAISRATFNKFKYTMRYDEFGRYILPGYENTVTLNVCELMGFGDRMILSKANVLQLGYDTQFNEPFVRVRAIDDDDQILTYNYAAEYGTNIYTTNRKEFMVSSGSLSANPMAGDYNGPDKFTLNISSGGNGTVTKTPEKTKYAQGDIVILNANPSASYTFEKWSDNNTENPRRIVVTSDLTLSATFKSE